MNRRKNIFWGFLLMFLSFPSVLLAQPTTPTGPPNPTGGGGSITLSNPLKAGDIEGILNNIINWLLIIAAPIAIIMTIWAGYIFLTSGGNEENVKKARSTLLYVVIGVAVLILSKGIISLVVSLIN